MEASHSAPGRILVVAERLIARAERMLGDVHTVPQAVYGAVLATEALELLAGRTPTTSLEALVLRHQFEAHAECQFVGTQHHVDVVSRITDVDREVSALSLWFGEDRRQRRVARWNAELAIVNKLIQVFGSHNQFDEEQVLQVCARRLHRKLWMDNHPFFKPVEWVPWYVEKLVASVPMFLGAIIGWIFVLGLLYWQAGATSLSSGLADAFVGFLGVQPPDDSNVWDSKSDGWNGAFCLIAVTVLLGFAHLGIFVSHLYSLITRK